MQSNSTVDDPIASLPQCELRIVHKGDLYCRHANVHSKKNIVSAEVCHRCIWREVPCDTPRPVPVEAGGKKLPPLTVRIGRYAVALQRWRYEGKPVRTQEQIDSLLEICKSCEHFTGAACAHPKCGCRVGSRKSMGNKLYLGTEDCPDDPSRWEKWLEQWRSAVERCHRSEREA